MEYILNPRIGFIGAGSIARFHIEAARAVGFDLYAIGSRPDSKNALSIYQEYKFTKLLSNISQISELNLDAIVVITNTENLLPIYNQISSLRVPILIEKPVVTSINGFSNSMDLDNTNTLVGFNRRFYSSIQDLKSKLNENSLIKFNWHISELAHLSKSNALDRIKSVRENSVHVLDLIAYLFGDIDDYSVERQYDEYGIKFISAILKFHGGVVGNLSLSFNSPETHKAQIYTGTDVYNLDPIEVLHKYSKIEIIQPRNDFPLRSYKSVGSKWTIDPVDVKYKPGFFKQYLELMNMVTSKERTIGASLRDAKIALQFAEILLDS